MTIETELPAVKVKAEVTPKMIAAAWATWHSRHGGKLGPGPAFVEAISAALTLKDDPGNGGDGEAERNFKLGDRVAKKSGSSWHGQIVGFYSTYLTPIGYCVESEREPGSVQIYPEAALVLSSYRKRSEADG